MTRYAALVQDAHTFEVVDTCPLADVGDHHAMRRTALRWGTSRGVTRMSGGRFRRHGASRGRLLDLFVVTIDAEGVATDLDKWDGEAWVYCAGNRHFMAKRTWRLAPEPVAARAAVEGSNRTDRGPEA